MEKTDKSAEEILDDAYKNIPGNAREYSLKFSLNAMHEFSAQQLSEYKEVIKELLPIVETFDWQNFNSHQAIIDRAKKLI